MLSDKLLNDCTLHLKGTHLHCLDLPQELEGRQEEGFEKLDLEWEGERELELGEAGLVRELQECSLQLH